MTKTQSFLMIPDSVSDRILLFDPIDGSLINDNFIDGSADTGLGIFTTPLNAIQVNREIWVSDQVADAIFRFDLSGNYLGIVNDSDGDGTPDGLDNIRGMEFAEGLIYVSNAGTNNGAPGDGEVVVVFDPAGNNLGFFDTGDPYDIRAYNGSLLVSDINSESSGGEDIDRYTLAGVNSTFDETFVESDGETGIDFAQQITVRQSNGNVLVAGFSTPGGFYEYDAAGNQVDLLNAEDGFAERVRAAYELGNGKIIWSGGDGVIVTDPVTGENTDIYTVNTLDFRPSARYIEQLVIPSEVPDLNGAIFLGDQRLDKIFVTQDLTGDGDANDPLEVSVYFDETNASGLSSPTGNVFTIFQSTNGSVFYGDGDTDSVYRLVDRNRDGDALDAGEANIWFADSDATPLPTPNGIAQGRDRAIYIVNAGTGSSPADVVYRTLDLNGDGDAQDDGESSVWLDLKTLNPSSSAFDIEFIGDTAYISDLVGGDDDVIYRAEDLDGNGTIEADETTVFIQDGNAFGVSLDFGITVDDQSVYTWESLDFAGPNSVYRLTDKDGSRDINTASEAVEVWNTDALPAGFEVFNGFSIALGPNKELVVTSNGGDSENNLFRLVDTNDDGDYFDAGETIPYLAANITGTIPERARAVEYAQTVSEDAFFFSTNRDSRIGKNEDIIQFDGSDFSVFFDGSSLGLRHANIDAFDIISDTVILMSFDRALRLEGLGHVDDSDVVKFTATSLGKGDTAGSFEMVLDGSELGLTRFTEDIDALTRMADGSLLFSTQGSARLSNGLRARNEDLIRYDATSGDVSLYFDGSDVRLGGFGENVAAVAMQGDELFLSTDGRFRVEGLRGRNEDVFNFTPTSTGVRTRGTFDSELFFDGSQSGFTGNIAAVDTGIG